MLVSFFWPIGCSLDIVKPSADVWEDKNGLSCLDSCTSLLTPRRSGGARCI
jgi:hypothetical protein